jgi:hypothetical protein
MRGPLGRVLDPLHAMQFRAALSTQVECLRPAERPSMSDRGRPLDTAGVRCLWHAGGTAGENGNAPRLAVMASGLAEGEARPR